MEALQDEAAVLEQMNHLYIGSRKAYLQQFASGQYAQIKRTLTDKQVTAHLRGEQTVGIFYCGQRSKFLSFDVDTLDWVTVNALITALRGAGISDEMVHTEFSGLKGYHVTIFFNRPLPIRRLASFGRAILSKLGEYAAKIELRPESNNGRGVKLPFAVHRGSGNRSCFVDSFTLQPYDDQASYFVGIRLLDADEMERIISEAVRKPLEFERPRPSEEALEEANRLFRDIRPPSVKNDLHAKAQRLLTKGMQDGESRRGSHSQFYVILFLKEQGWTQDEVTAKVIEWALREKAAGRVDHSEAHVRADITKHVKQVFDNDLELRDSRPFVACDQDLAYAASFKRVTMKKTVWCLIILSRIFADDEGCFYAAYSKIEEMTGMSSRSIARNMTALMDGGVLEKVKDGDYVRRKAAQYRVNRVVCIDESDGRTFDCTSYRELFDTSYRLVKEWRNTII